MKISGALQHCHQRQVVHLDVKPSNILVSEKEPCLLNFGTYQCFDLVCEGDQRRSL